MPFLRRHDGRRIHYAERGAGATGTPAVMLIHGASASSAIWMMTLSRLARRHRIVAVDLPGHGPSGRLATPASLLAYRDAVGELGAGLGLGRAILVGHSMGALVAIEAALAWPDRVTGLVLVAAAPRLPVTDGLLAAVTERYAEFPAWLAERGLSPRAPAALRRGFLAAGTAAPPDIAREDFLACRDADYAEALASVRAPMIWLDGADDGMLADRGTRPGVVRTLTDVGHMIPLEAPAEIAEAVATLAGKLVQ